MCKQALLTAPRILKITNFTMPIPKENEVVLQVSHSGVCGTDLAIYSGSYPVPLPLVLGHEYTGTTIAWGSQVPTHLHNARVTGEINITCKIITPETLCSNCRNGIESHCLTRTTVGIYRAGSFTTHLVVPWQILHLIPQELSLEAASFTEPMAAAIQTFELNPLPKKMILLGCGRLGSLILDYAVKNGVETTVISRSEKSLSLAKKLGAIQVYPSSDSTNLERVLDWTKGQGADLVIEATGSENGLNEALKFVKARGTISLKSTTGAPVKNFDTTRLVVDEITLNGTRCGPFDKALKWLAKEQNVLRQLDIVKFPLAEAKQAMEAAKTRGKVLLVNS